MPSGRIISPKLEMLMIHYSSIYFVLAQQLILYGLQAAHYQYKPSVNLFKSITCNLGWISEHLGQTGFYAVLMHDFVVWSLYFTIS